MEIFEAIIYNISVMVAGVYSSHRLQYSESKRVIFSGEYVAVLMIFVSLFLVAYPILLRNEYLVHLAFVPLLFSGRYTSTIYTLTATFIASLVGVFIFGNSIIYGITLVVIAGTVGAVGPFLKQNDIISLLILNLISIIILLFLALLSPIYELVEVLVLIPISFIIATVSAIIFVDIWHFFSLVNHYENEDRYDCSADLDSVGEFDRHLNEVSSKAEEERQNLALLLIDIDGFEGVNDHYSYQSGGAVLKQTSRLLENYVPNQLKIFRNGGGEFSVVIRDYTLDQNMKLVENIRGGVEKSSSCLPNKEIIKLSVSIGVRYLAQEDRKSQRKVFKNANDMVYVAKSEGRNKVIFNPIVRL